MNGVGLSEFSIAFLYDYAAYHCLSVASLNRMAMKDTTLSDGTFIPRGSLINANMVTIHNDPDIYPSPSEFRPWRFSEMRDKSPDDAVKHQSVNTSAEYLTFGHGKHACPGRFFATNELKAMMAYLVLNYDIRAEEEGVRPPNVIDALTIIPDPTAKVLFRKRVSNIRAARFDVE